MAREIIFASNTYLIRQNGVKSDSEWTKFQQWQNSNTHEHECGAPSAVEFLYQKKGAILHSWNMENCKRITSATTKRDSNERGAKSDCKAKLPMKTRFEIEEKDGIRHNDDDFYGTNNLFLLFFVLLRKGKSE